MSMQIEIVNVSISTVPTAKGSYQVADVAYKNKSFQDKLEGKKIMSFSNKDVFNTLSKAQFGDVFNVDREKNDKGFWDWTAVNSDTGNVGGGDRPVAVPASTGAVHAPAVKSNPSPKSTYETPEERAARQVLIVRQSSLANAMEYAVANKVKDEAEILGLAQRFHDWVFDKKEEAVVEIAEPPKNFFEGMSDDIPY